MISLPQLWLPILVSAVLVFVASSLIHMVVKWHNSDYLTLSNEDEVRAAIRKTNPAPGQYLLPSISDMSQLKTPEVQRKFTEGPVGFLALKKSGTPNMAPGAGAVVRLRPRGLDLRRLSRLADPVPGHAIFQGVPGRRNHRLPRLRCGRSACSHLDGKALALGGKGARRWIHLRAADWGRVRLALAPVSARPGRESFRDARIFRRSRCPQELLHRRWGLRERAEGASPEGVAMMKSFLITLAVLVAGACGSSTG